MARRTITKASSPNCIAASMCQATNEFARISIARYCSFLDPLIPAGGDSSAEKTWGLPARLVHLCRDQQLRPAIELEPLSPVWTLVPPHA